jgi:hypothetical protein
MESTKNEKTNIFGKNHHNFLWGLRMSTFIFWRLPFFAKYTYWWSPLEQRHKIGKKKHWVNIWNSCEYKYSRTMMTNIESDQCIQRGLMNILETHEKKFLIINPQRHGTTKGKHFFLLNLFTSTSQFILIMSQICPNVFFNMFPNITTFYPIAQIWTQLINLYM